jgi:hypothetical protein
VRIARATTVALASAALSIGLLPATPVSAASTSDNLVSNGTFDSGVAGWVASSDTKLTQTATANPSAMLRAVAKGVTLSVTSTTAGLPAGSYTVSVKIRANKAKQKGTLSLSGSGDSSELDFKLPKKGKWYTYTASATTTATGPVTIEVEALKATLARKVRVDAVSLVSTTSEPSTEEPGTSSAAAAATGKYTLSNGCTLNAKGLGNCDPLFGGATDLNADPSSLESSFGHIYGVRRTYFQSSQVSAAVKTVKADLAAGRIPWISFKLPYGWKDMVAGKGDSWVKDIVTQLDAVNGPVWLAFHHEPEKDEADITRWTKMQERIGPMVRKSDNVAFTVVLTGYHQIFGATEFRLDNIWPNTTVDLAGFDIYESYGTLSAGKLKLTAPALRANYFDTISAWAAKKGMEWGLAETGLSDRAATDYPSWMQQTYKELKATNAAAMAYFNTKLNDTATWELSTAAEKADFKAALKLSPSVPAMKP